MPDELDLSLLHTLGGLREGEEELPQEEETAAAAPAQPVIEPSPEIVSQLSDMGFSTEACKKAAFHSSNAGVEAAMNWMMAHMDDPDLNTPFVNPTAAKPAAGGGGFVPDPEAMSMLMAMSFSEAQAKKALKNTQVGLKTMELLFKIVLRSMHVNC